jgi:hypothetical protein
MRRTRRDAERDLEAQLRAARPAPTAEVTRAIADHVRPRRGVMGTLARVPLGLAGGLTAIVVAVALALGGGTAALNSAGNALNVRSSKVKVAQAPAIQQYDDDDDVLICTFGITQDVSPLIAAIQVGLGISTYGPCPGDDPDTLSTSTRTTRHR